MAWVWKWKSMSTARPSSDKTPFLANHKLLGACVVYWLDYPDDILFCEPLNPVPDGIADLLLYPTHNFYHSRTYEEFSGWAELPEITELTSGMQAKLGGVTVFIPNIGSTVRGNPIAINSGQVLPKAGIKFAQSIVSAIHAAAGAPILHTGTRTILALSGILASTTTPVIKLGSRVFPATSPLVSALSSPTIIQALYGRATAAGALLGNEEVGYAVDFKNDSVLVRAPSQPSLQFSGSVQAAITAGLMTYTRADALASYHNSAGNLVTAPANTWRRAYDPISHAVLGFFSEKASQNLFQYSRALTTGIGIWGNVGGAFVMNNQTDPAGGTEAGTFTTSGSGSFARRETQQANLFAVSANTPYTVSFYAKAGNTDFVHSTFEIKELSGLGTAQGVRVAVQLSTQTISTSQYGTGSTIYNARMENVGNGWYRISYTAVLGASGTCLVFFGPSSSLGYAFTASLTAYFFGAQFETGYVCTSYIDNPNTALNSRFADKLQTSLSLIPWNAAGGTLVTKGYTNALGDQQFYPDFLGLDDGSTSAAGIDFIYLDPVNDQRRFDVRNANAYVAALQYASVAIPKSYDRWAARFGSNDYQLAVNGNLGPGSTSGAMPALNRMCFGRGYTDGFWLNGMLDHAIYIPRKLTNIQLQSMST